MFDDDEESGFFTKYLSDPRITLPFVRAGPLARLVWRSSMPSKQRWKTNQQCYC
jgi:hypothetical protein